MKACKACTCPAAIAKKEPGVSNRDINGLMDMGSLHVWSKVLEGHPMCGANSRQDMAAVFALGEGKEGSGGGGWPIIGGIDVRLVHQLPGKLAEGHAPHSPFDKNNL